MPPAAVRTIRRGNDVCREVVSPAGCAVAVTYWDLWFAIVVVTDFGGDWDRLAGHLRQQGKSDYSYRRYAVEGLLCHLVHLRQALTEAGLTPQDVIAGTDPDLVKRQKARARDKILRARPSEPDKSFWMRNTPRAEHEARALRGYWSRFPVSPDRYAAQIEGLFKPSGFYEENQSFALARKLSACLDREEKQANDAELRALYRAYLTVVIEQMQRVDDSYGVMGDTYNEVLEGYIRLDRSTLGMPLADFLQDLLELFIWEDRAFTARQQPVFFAGLDGAEALLAEAILRTQWDELRELDLEYPAERALTLLGMLCTQQRMFDRFVDLARVMGSREWQRVTEMAEIAEKHKQYDLAIAVYEASEGPGYHRDLLQKKCAELQDRLGKRPKGRKSKRAA